MASSSDTNPAPENNTDHAVDPNKSSGTSPPASLVETFSQSLPSQSEADVVEGLSKLTPAEFDALRAELVKDMNALVLSCARVAHEELFEEHWGCRYASESDKELANGDEPHVAMVVYFDNHDHPVVREHIVRRLRKYVETVGGAEVARATYPPPPDPQPDYTLAIMFQGVNLGDFREVMNKAIGEGLRLADAAARA